jgi:hypothetical protein
MAGLTNKNCEELVQQSEEIGNLEKEIGNLENEISKNAKLCGNLERIDAFKIGKGEFVEVLEKAVTAHKNWVKNVETMVTEMKLKPVQLDGTKCGFGHFYNSITVYDKKIIDEWNSIDVVHKTLHKTGHDIIHAIETNNRLEAEKYLKSAEGYSKEIVGKLEKIVGIMR